jgi:hypothetical protein
MDCAFLKKSQEHFGLRQIKMPRMLASANIGAGVNLKQDRKMQWHHPAIKNPEVQKRTPGQLNFQETPQKRRV